MTDFFFKLSKVESGLSPLLNKARYAADLTRRNSRPHQKSSKHPQLLFQQGFQPRTFTTDPHSSSPCVNIWCRCEGRGPWQRPGAGPAGSAWAGAADGFKPCGYLLGRDHTHKEAGPPRRSWAKRQTCLTWTARLRNVQDWTRCLVLRRCDDDCLVRKIVAIDFF